METADSPQAWLDQIEGGDCQDTTTGTRVPTALQEIVAARLEELNAAHLLANARKQAGMTQAEVAAKLGVRRAAVSQTESRPIEQVSVGTVVRYITAIGGSVELEAALRLFEKATPQPVDRTREIPS